MNSPLQDHQRRRQELPARHRGQPGRRGGGAGGPAVAGGRGGAADAVLGVGRDVGATDDAKKLLAEEESKILSEEQVRNVHGRQLKHWQTCHLSHLTFSMG